MGKRSFWQGDWQESRGTGEGMEAKDGGWDQGGGSQVSEKSVTSGGTKKSGEMA